MEELTVYSSTIDGEFGDWGYRPVSLSFQDGRRAYSFFVGNKLAGQIFPHRKRQWAAVPFAPGWSLEGVRGFASRLDAAEYIVSVWHEVEKYPDRYPLLTSEDLLARSV